MLGVLRGRCVSGTLIFCNKKSTAETLHKRITAALLSGANEAHQRQAEGVTRSVPSLLHGKFTEHERKSVYEACVGGQVDTLICTDLVSRGLDTVHVGRVIMYDFAMNMIDFIHRAGRTGRLPGTPGEVICLVGKRDTSLAAVIKRAVSTGKPLTRLAEGPSKTANSRKGRRVRTPAFSRASANRSNALLTVKRPAARGAWTKSVITRPPR